MYTHGGPRGAIWHPVFGRVVNLEPPPADIRLLWGIFMAGTGHVICGNQMCDILRIISYTLFYDACYMHSSSNFR